MRVWRTVNRETISLQDPDELFKFLKRSYAYNKYLIN